MMIINLKYFLNEFKINMKNNEGENDEQVIPIEIEMPEEIQSAPTEIEQPAVESTPQIEINEPAEQPDDAKQDDSDSGGCNSDWEIDEDDENEEVDIDKNLPFETQFPMRKTFSFDNIIISSDFDGGNMRRWKPSETDPIKLIQNSPENIEQQNIEKKFDIWISWDGLPYRKSGLKTWFYFYVQGASNGETIKFTIK